MPGGSALPPGWEDRKNAMSERDVALGGDAATKFASSSLSAYGSGGEAYLTSDQVREYYGQKIEAEQQGEQVAAAKDENSSGGGGGQGAGASPSSSNLPVGWEQRQRRNAADEKQHGAFARNQPPPPVAGKSPPSSGGTASSSTPQNPGPKEEGEFGGAEVALVQVATNTLDALARTLENRRVELPQEERAALAAAMKRAMNAVASCR